VSDLTPEDKALLDLARGGHEPQAADRGRVRVALAAPLGLAAGLASSSAGAVGGASAGVLSTTGLLVLKIVGVVAVATGVAGGGIAVHRGLWTPSPPATTAARAVAAASPAPAPTSSTWSPAAGSVPRPAATAVREAPAEEPPQAPPAQPFAMGQPPAPPTQSLGPARATPSPTDSDPWRTEARVVSSPRQDDVPAVSERASANDVPSALPTPTTLRAETALIRAGLDALHGGDPARALALFNQHAREFPGGILSDERDVERITALCDLGRNAEARDAAASFLSRRPSGSLAGRVLSSCGGDRSPSIP
jgi:hypothetical protein